MLEGTDLMFNTESVSSNISYKPSNYNLPMQNSYCDHRNFNIVNQALKCGVRHMDEDSPISVIRRPFGELIVVPDKGIRSKCRSSPCIFHVVSSLSTKFCYYILALYLYTLAQTSPNIIIL
jgi:hypothetical protein